LRKGLGSWMSWSRFLNIVIKKKKLYQLSRTMIIWLRPGLPFNRFSTRCDNDWFGVIDLISLTVLSLWGIPGSIIFK
jgi:hypothetical protein